jgi:hypothetical protein
LERLSQSYKEIKELKMVENTLLQELIEAGEKFIRAQQIVLSAASDSERKETQKMFDSAQKDLTELIQKSSNMPEFADMIKESGVDHALIEKLSHAGIDIDHQMRLLRNLSQSTEHSFNDMHNIDQRINDIVQELKNPNLSSQAKNNLLEALQNLLSRLQKSEVNYDAFEKGVRRYSESVASKDAHAFEKLLTILKDAQVNLSGTDYETLITKLGIKDREMMDQLTQILQSYQSIHVDTQKGKSEEKSISELIKKITNSINAAKSKEGDIASVIQNVASLLALVEQRYRPLEKIDLEKVANALRMLSTAGPLAHGIYAALKGKHPSLKGAISDFVSKLKPKKPAKQTI